MMSGSRWRPTSTTPPDLFGDLFDAMDEFLTLPTSEAVLEEIRNDSDKAREAFLALKGSDFANETAIVEFLEEAYPIIDDYDINGYAEYFKLLLMRVSFGNTTCVIDSMILFLCDSYFPVPLPTSICELHRMNTANAHLSGLLEDFEHAFDSYARSQNPADLKTCIAKASNYAEGLASSTNGKAGTLGALCNQIGDWPHDKVKEALQNLYKFCSDYPGIRHAGDPRGIRRDLSVKDSTLICLLLIGFSGYLSPNVDERFVLGA